MRITNVIVLFLLLIISIETFCQDSTVKLKYDKSYIHSYTDQITSRFYLLREQIGFQIRPAYRNQTVNYRANIGVKIGLAAIYKWYGVGLAIKMPFVGTGNDIRGKSSIIDLRINAYGRALAAELSYSDYKGFYMQNTDALYNHWQTGDPKYIRPDMRILAYGGIFYYIPNFKKHSFRAAYLQNERQKKSSGSLLVVPSFLHARLGADSSVVPAVFAEKYDIPPNEHIIDGKFYTIGLSIGYSYTFVFLEYFYINMSIVPGAFVRVRNYETTWDTREDTKIIALWLARAAIGYNADKFYIGAGGVFGFNNAPFPEGNLSFQFDLNQYRFWVGTRFGVKKK